ncbi:hypothetical protein CSB69_3986 [Morganella morganii]|nr:hypothetical protein CSB69_3986 [Morganella morganii]EMP52192.1 hypothetical protein C790_04014 [Morganella morganii SC01]
MNTELINLFQYVITHQLKCINKPRCMKTITDCMMNLYRNR